MKFKQMLAIGVLALISSGTAAAATSQLNGVEVAESGKGLIISLKTTGSYSHKEYRVDPHTVAVDLNDVSADPKVDRNATSSSALLNSYKVTSYTSASGAEVTRLELHVGDGVRVDAVDQSYGMDLQLHVDPSAAVSANAPVEAAPVSAATQQPESRASVPAYAQAVKQSYKVSPVGQSASSTKADNSSSSTTSALADADTVHEQAATPKTEIRIETAAAAESAAAPVKILSVTTRSHDGSLEIMVDGPESANAFLLKQPDRLVLDFNNAVLKTPVRKIAVHTGDVEQIRLGRFQAQPPVTRIVVDLSGPREYDVLRAAHRVIVRVKGVNAQASTAPIPAAEAPVTAPATASAAPAIETASASPANPAATTTSAPVEAAAVATATTAPVSAPTVTAALPARATPATPPVAKSAAPAAEAAVSAAPPDNSAASAAPAPRQPRARVQLASATTTPAKASRKAEPLEVDSAAESATGPQPATHQSGADATIGTVAPAQRSSRAVATLARTDTAAVEAAQSAAPAPSAAAPKAASQSSATAASRYTGEPISVNLKDVDLKDFFRLIHEISGLNIVLDPNVRGTVTLVLDDVPWDQALDIVLKNNALDRELQGNVLRIASIDTLRKEAVDRRAQSEAVALAVDRQTINRTLSYAKASDVMLTVKKFLSARGDVIFDNRTNSIIISDIPSVIPTLDRLIAQLDKKSQEVEIEVRVVSATRSFSRDLGAQIGFNWGNGVTTAGGSNPNGSTASTTGTTTTSSSTVPLFGNFPASGATTGFSISNITKSYGIDAILTAAETHNLAKVLSRPRVVTQSNVKAEVKQGVKIPVYQAATGTTNATVSYVDAVLRLSVTPQITADGTIFLTVDVENTQPNGTINGNYILTTQQATTQVLVTNGGTVVIGGVIQTTNSVSTIQTPLLGSIPLLGNLFKERLVKTETDELIFFITPKIIET